MNIPTVTKKHFALLLLSVFTAFTSCKKETKPQDNAPTTRPRLFSVEQDDHNFMIFGYTNKGYLNKFKAVSELHTSEAHFGYNDANKPISGVWDDHDLQFLYVNGRLDKVTFADATDDELPVVNYLKFNYEDGRVSHTVNYERDGDDFIPYVKHAYEYYPNGDVKTETYYYLNQEADDWQEVERTEYEYDDQVNALQVPDEVAYVLYLNKSAHNVKKVTIYDITGQLSETKTYTLNYNKFGLPTTVNEKIEYPNSPTINRVLTYSYQ